MTDKEQQIEEMNSIMQEAYNDHCENVSCVKCPYFGMQHGKNEEMSTFYCQNYLEATTLYNAGYRKESETAKEFAKEFLKMTDKFADFTDIINYILKARFGVEID